MLVRACEILHSAGDRGYPGPPGLPSIPYPSEYVEKGEPGTPGISGLPGFTGPRGKTAFIHLCTAFSFHNCHKSNQSEWRGRQPTSLEN